VHNLALSSVLVNLPVHSPVSLQLQNSYCVQSLTILLAARWSYKQDTHTSVVQPDRFSSKDVTKPARKIKFTKKKFLYHAVSPLQVAWCHTKCEARTLAGTFSRHPTEHPPRTNHTHKLHPRVVRWRWSQFESEGKLKRFDGSAENNLITNYLIIECQ
jgi:hypothetical protein